MHLESLIIFSLVNEDVKRNLCTHYIAMRKIQWRLLTLQMCDAGLQLQNNGVSHSGF